MSGFEAVSTPPPGRGARVLAATVRKHDGRRVSVELDDGGEVLELPARDVEPDWRWRPGDRVIVEANKDTNAMSVCPLVRTVSDRRGTVLLVENVDGRETVFGSRESG